ncbi:hypothetical protein M899_1664 [Bacteriovorax sp. BSW11_IV]|uniref:hypothetical protein n=1 Tax=Bacteriovorax sp. BSW11_IV TaxID=1353529 RepID=UPI00038A2155|nr:hypothetical protein [Bacteriovorax sp. BSW11_IV]EQC49352.1 hypothetical protein M899_1664 [Bacteriovorax sp. BSW11_IV]
MQNNRRKTLLINRTFQLSFIKLAFAFLCMIYLLCVGVGVWLINPIFDYAQSLGSKEMNELTLLLDELAFYGPIVLGILFVVISCFVVAASLLMTHKIAGPLYNLEESMKGMLENNELRSIRFRRGDYFSNIESSFNRFIDQITLK